MKKLKVVLGLVMATMFAFTGCVQVVQTEEGKNKKVVATVYGEDITKSEFDKRFEPLLINIEHQYKLQEEKDAKLKSEGKQVNTTDKNRLPAGKEAFMKSQKESYLNDLTQEKVYLYNAKKKKVEVTDKEVDDAVKGMIDTGIQQYGSEDKFKEETNKMTGLKYDQYKAFLKDAIKVQLVQKKLQEVIIKNVKVTDQEAKVEYDKNSYAYTEKPNKLYFTHILLDSKEEADKVKKELDNGGDMAKLAKKYSKDDGSKDNGGRYKDGLEYANLDPAFLDAALKLKIGEISAPVQGQHGFYIIKVEKKEEYPKKAFDKVKEEVKASLLQQKQMTETQKEVATWEKDSKIKTYIENL